MTSSVARLTRVLATSLVVLLLAAPAFAGTMYFGELLTSDHSMLFEKNVRVTMEAGYLPSDPQSLYMNGHMEHGAGIDDGLLSHRGDYTLFTHRFTPSTQYSHVTGAHLFVGVRDNAWLDGREAVSIALNDDFWQTGGAWASLFHGDVTAYFSNDEDELKVAVVSRRGSSVVDFSKVVWKFETKVDGGLPGTGAQPVPEPTGFALFCVGAVVLRRATRRRA